MCSLLAFIYMRICLCVHNIYVSYSHILRDTTCVGGWETYDDNEDIHPDSYNYRV